ncbi:MAG: hypothetical protein FWD32_01355 [Firmicutes bacterium]|nr:hypothetical protein [Bacillota bacterium]
MSKINGEVISANGKIIIKCNKQVKVRRDWGLVNPGTRIEGDKTKIIPRKQKYKQDFKAPEY